MPTAIIILLSVLLTLGICIIVAIIIWAMRRRRKKRQELESAAHDNQEAGAGVSGETLSSPEAKQVPAIEEQEPFICELDGGGTERPISQLPAGRENSRYELDGEFVASRSGEQ